MTSTPPTVSIGMSVRNNAATLAVTLRSILRQTCADWELILIDDGSTDATREVAKSFADPRIRLLCHEVSGGLARRLNEAVDIARGRYFARTDGDDVSFPERLELQAAYLDSHPGIDLLGSGGVVFDEDGVPLGVRLTPTTHEDICRQPWSGFYLAHPSWMGRTEWFRRNRYDENAVKSQDYDLLLRTHRQSCFAALPDILIGYREKRRLEYRKILSSRWHTICSQTRFAQATGDWWHWSGAVAQQGAKAVVDGVAIATGRERALLTHRALPVSGALTFLWTELWRELNGGAVR